MATFLLSRSLSKRVLVLREGALRLANGDMTTPIPIGGNDELADLAVSFNDMAENLRKTTTSIDNLNQEIAERKKVEETLRRSREQYETIIRTTMDGFWIADTQGRFLEVNEAYCRLTGYSREELLSMNIKDVEVSAYIVPNIEEIIRKGGGRFEAQHTCKDGSVVDVEVSINSNEKENKLFCFLRDITERRQAEQRQAELLKEVERANLELKEFAYAASHDLKAPLRGIRSLAGWISTDHGEKLDDEGREQLNLLIGRVDRMQQLIDGILQYSRIGRVEEENTMVHLNELVPDIIDLIALPENIQVTIDNELPVIKCGETQITQVFQNLLSNAVKYMDKPQGHIRVGCVEENGFWKFSIADNGPGIEKEYFEKIFEIFQTLSRHDDKGGTGIGLTLVKKIVALYGGEIWLESELGQGSTFYFTLPKQDTEVLQEKLEPNIVGERR
jgi:PAS domain S-box-containing protein